MPGSLIELLTVLSSYGLGGGVVLLIAFFILWTASTVVVIREVVRLKPAQRRDLIKFMKAIRCRGGRRRNRSSCRCFRA